MQAAAYHAIHAMTEKAKESVQNAAGVFIKSWLPVVLATIGGALWAGKMDSRLAAVEKGFAAVPEIIKDHATDADKHMPYAEKRKEFVLRTEWELSQAMQMASDERQRQILTLTTRMDESLRTIKEEIRLLKGAHND